jgi:hypothetical protein
MAAHLLRAALLGDPWGNQVSQGSSQDKPKTGNSRGATDLGEGVAEGSGIQRTGRA